MDEGLIQLPKKKQLVRFYLREREAVQTVTTLTRDEIKAIIFADPQFAGHFQRLPCIAADQSEMDMYVNTSDKLHFAIIAFMDLDETEPKIERVPPGAQVRPIARPH